MSSALLVIHGPDAQDFLQRLTTNNVEALGAGDGQPSALLAPSGRVQSVFSLLKTDKEFFTLLLPSRLLDTTYELLEKVHFREKFEIEKTTARVELLAGGELEKELTQQLGPEFTFPEAGQFSLYGKTLFYRDPLFSTPLLWVPVLSETNAPGLPPSLTDAQWKHLRILSGYPIYGKDFDENTIALEAVEHAIARNKGCYPGQEVIERIYAYGAPARKLVRLEIKSQKGEALEGETLHFKDKKEAGHITSAVFCPEAKNTMAIACVKKEFLKEEILMAGEAKAFILSR